ncbi:MAG: DMT family transporter [Reyranella sp.]|uniref:DMT family transporter n=1 Tax=Reyranella sp. TaxID=1929291 RepID=UPI001AC7624F|nr:DMT family transporter [Reyranella sp.]MBN9089712.1 DMT family transporter [Reyranella sp.]
MNRVWLGTLLLVASGAVYSTAGLFTRLIQVDAWTLLFWRGLFGGSFLAVVVVLQERGRLWRSIRAMGWEGGAVAICSAVATVCFLNAMRLTAIADVLVIDAAIPFITAALAWAILGERESLFTLGATAAAFAGMAIMAGPAIAHGQVAGDALAFVMATLISLVIVLIRRKQGISMVPAVCGSAFLCALIVWPFASPLQVDAGNLGLLALFGTSQFGLGLLLLAVGTPLVSATRGALLGVLQTPLGTLWVWLAFSEQPATLTLIGGIVVLAAVIIDMLAPHAISTSSMDSTRSGSPA